MQHHCKRLFSLLLAVLMVVSMLPGAALADDTMEVIELDLGQTLTISDGEIVIEETPVTDTSVAAEIPLETETPEEPEAPAGESESTPAPAEAPVEEAIVEEEAPETDGEGESDGVIDTEAELSAALTAGGTVTLGGNIEVNTMIAIPAGITATLDLAGFAITSGYQDGYGAASDTPKHIYPLDVYGNLTIKDSSENGSITGRGIYVQSGSTLTIEGGSIYGIDSNGGSAIYQYGGEIVINGGHIEQKAEGTYNFAINAGGGTVTVKDGWVGGNHGAIAAGGAAVTIINGTFVCTGSANMTDNVLYTYGSGSIVINGGTFIADSDSASGGCCVYDANGGTTINGGDFSNSSGGDVWGTTGTTITGGTFANLTETSHVAVGATITNGGTTYTMTESGLVEQTTMSYEEFNTAVKAATDGVYDGQGITVVLKDTERSYQNNNTAQFFVGATNVNITDPVDAVKVSNVIFKFEDDDTDNNYTSGELQVFANTIEFTSCTFIGTAVSPWGVNNNTNAVTATFTNCTWKDLSGRYGVHQNRASTLKVIGCTFENCERGIHTNSSTPVAITITGNTFTGIGDGYGVLCLAENGDISAATLNISGNTAEGQVMLRQLNNNTTYEQVSAILDTNNNTYGTAYVANSIVPAPAYAAMIGTTGYSTLQEALSAASSGDTVSIQKDITEALNEVKIPASVTIEGNNHTVTTTGTTPYSYDCMFYSEGDCTVQNLTVVADSVASTSTQAFNLGNGGTLKNVTVHSAFPYGVFVGNAAVTVDGCTFNTTSYGIYSDVWSIGKATITGSTFNGARAAMLYCPAEFTGNIVNTDKGISAANDNIIISGNTFTAGRAVSFTNACTFTGNVITSAEVYVEAKAAVDLSGNYWGSETGPSESQLITESSGSITYTSYYTDADLTELVTNAVAMIGDQGYATLDEAIAAAEEMTGNVTITLCDDITGSYTLTEKVGLYLTIDGANKTMNGTITVKALSDTNDNRRTTIQNVNFVDTNDAASVVFIQSTETNHYPRISVIGCTFTGSGYEDDVDEDVAIKLKSAYSAEIENCTGTGLHSFLQNTSGVGFNIYNVTVTDSNGGLAMGTAQNVTIRNCNITTNTYGIRLDAVLDTSVTLNGNTVNSYIPVCVRNATATEYNLTMSGSGSSYTATNSDGVWMAICATEYEEGVALNKPSGKVKITWTTDVLDESGVYGAYEWPIEVVFGDGYTRGFDSLASAMSLGYSGSTEKTVIVHKDITESMSSLEGNITTDNPDGVTIKNTIEDEWIYCSDNFTIGEGVTYDATGYGSGLFVYANDAVINGTVLTDCYYQRYANTKLTINEPGSMTVKTETFILRYTEGDADAGIYIVGDNDDSTVGLTASVIYFYQGVINAKNADIQVGTYWQTNTTDITAVPNNSGSANLILDNSNMTVTVNEHNMKATGNSTVTLTNGSAVSVAGGYEGVAVTMDETSSMTKNGEAVLAAKIGNVYYTTLHAAMDAAADGDTVTLLADVTASDIITIVAGITLDGNNHTLTSSASRAINVDTTKEVTIKDLTIIGKVDACERGINIINNAGTTNVENVTAYGAAGAFKPIMVATSAGAATVNVTNSILTGWCAIQTHGAGSTVSIKDSTLTGINTQDDVDTTNNEFSTIAIGANAANVTVTVTNSIITAKSKEGCETQYIFGHNDDITGSTVTLDATLVLEGDNTGYLNADADQVTITVKSEYADELEAEGYAYIANGNGTVTVAKVVATIGEKGYASVANALAAATSGQTVRLNANATEDTVLVYPGITLDLNGQTLTAEYVVGFNGGSVIDSSASDNDPDGFLNLPKGNLVLAENNGMFPVYNGTDGYVFSDVLYGKSNATIENGIRVNFLYAPVLDVVELLKDGADDNEVQLVVRLTWSTDTGTSYQNFVYAEDDISTFYTSNTGSQGGYGSMLYLDITGIANMKGLTVTPIVISSSNAIDAGPTLDVDSMAWK